MAVMLGTQAILRRLVAPEDWGFWHWAVDFLFVILSQVRDLGTPAHVVRDPKRPYGNFLAVELGWGLAATMIVAAASPALAKLSPDPSLQGVVLVQALAIFLFVEGLGKIPQTFFEAEIQVDRLLWPELVRNFIYVATSLYLAAEGHGVWSLVVAHVASATVFAGHLWWRALRPRAGTDDRRITLGWIPGGTWPLVRSSLPLAGMAMVLLAVESVDYQIVGLMVDEEVVGFYGGALTLALLIMRAFEWPLRRSLYPTFVAVKDDPARFFETYRLSTILLMTVHVPAALGLHYNAEFILTLAWGEPYASATVFLEILAMMALVQPFSRCAEDVLLPRHEEGLMTISAILNLVAIIGVGIVLTSRLGAEGMAWAKLATPGSLLLAWAVWRVDAAGFRRLLVDLLLIYAVGFGLFASAAALGGEHLGLRFALSTVAGILTLSACGLLFGRSFREFFKSA